MGLLLISTLSIAMTTVIACVHSGYITVTMTATATAIVQTTLTLTTTVTTVASSSASRCNSSTAAQPLKLPASPPRPCVLQLHHFYQQPKPNRRAKDMRRSFEAKEKQRRDNSGSAKGMANILKRTGDKSETHMRRRFEAKKDMRTHQKQPRAVAAKKGNPSVFWVKARVKRRWPPPCGLRPDRLLNNCTASTYVCTCL